MLTILWVYDISVVWPYVCRVTYAMGIWHVRRVTYAVGTGYARRVTYTVGIWYVRHVTYAEGMYHVGGTLVNILLTYCGYMVRPWCDLCCGYMICPPCDLCFGYRNWYQYWGHCCLSPSGCGELPRSLMRQQWPKLGYQFLFYNDETKLIINKQILSI